MTGPDAALKLFALSMDFGQPTIELTQLLPHPKCDSLTATNKYQVTYVLPQESVEMVDTKKSLATVLADGRKYEIVSLLHDKGEIAFGPLKAATGYKHNQSFVRALHRLEVLGLIDHTYRYGSPEVYSFYQITGYGERIVKLAREIK